MPLDGFVHRPSVYDNEFYRRSRWQFKFVLWPTRCDLSKRRLWLKKAYCGTRIITGPGEPIYEHRWLSKESFMKAVFKGVIQI